MAAKTIEMAVALGICSGPLEDMKQNILNELRDYFAHRTMILGESATAMDLFNDAFKNIPAISEVSVKKIEEEMGALSF